MRLHTRIDERTGAFVALGLAKASRRPAAVVTTSGTATANLHPAVLEASHAGVTLVAVTADRPARRGRSRTGIHEERQGRVGRQGQALLHVRDVAPEEDVLLRIVVGQEGARLFRRRGSGKAGNVHEPGRIARRPCRHILHRIGNEAAIDEEPALGAQEVERRIDMPARLTLACGQKIALARMVERAAQAHRHVVDGFPCRFAGEQRVDRTGRLVNALVDRGEKRILPPHALDLPSAERDQHRECAEAGDEDRHDSPSPEAQGRPRALAVSARRHARATGLRPRWSGTAGRPSSPWPAASAAPPG